MILRVSLISLLVLGLLGFLGVAWVALSPPPAEVAATAAPQARVSVIVAARTLRAGTLLRPEDMAAIEVPADDVPAGANIDSPQQRASLAGQMVRVTTTPGTPLLPDALLRHGDRGFLAMLLGPGMRATSIGVDTVTGIAGLVWPGDRVDIVLTQQMNDDALPVARRVAAETVLADTRVIAIDQAISQGVTGEGPDMGRTVRTVTLEVTPVQAERLAVAARLGRLSLTVRSAEAEAPAGPDGLQVATWGGDVSNALRNGTPAATASRSVNVHLGSSRREEFRF
jgi:pilus assembly protein CpaB